MSKILCLLRHRPNLFGIAPIDGHSYYETYQNDEVQILKCMECSHYSVGYFNGGEPEAQKPPQKTASQMNYTTNKAGNEEVI